MQVKGHEVLDIWLDCSQAVTILESLLDRCDGRDKVGLRNQSITVSEKGRSRKEEDCEEVKRRNFVFQTTQTREISLP